MTTEDSGLAFSLLSAVRNRPDVAYPLAEVYADYLSDAVLAEEYGFVRSWYGEHHFRDCQWTPSPIQFATAVAARTERLRVGTAVTCVPFHDPRRLAEDVAVADILSGGRFDFGVGPGSQFEEFRSFGVDSKEMTGRTFEAVDWIRRAFAEAEEFSHAGRYYTIPQVKFTTRPVQDPVPVWYGGMGPKNLARAAERGFDFIGPFNPGYDALLEAAGRRPEEHRIALMQQVCVADSSEAAWDAAGEGLEYFTNFYAMRKDLTGAPADPSRRITIDMLRDGRAAFWKVAVGTPEEVIRALTPSVDGSRGRTTELACAFRHAGMRNKEAHRSMELFAREVMPALTEIAASVRRGAAAVSVAAATGNRRGGAM